MKRKTLARMMEAGANSVKTSTGFARSGATAADVALMRRAVGPDVGVKAAGGIRTYAGVLAPIEADDSVVILEGAED